MRKVKKNGTCKFSTFDPYARRRAARLKKELLESKDSGVSSLKSPGQKKRVVKKRLSLKSTDEKIYITKSEIAEHKMSRERNRSKVLDWLVSTDFDEKNSIASKEKNAVAVDPDLLREYLTSSPIMTRSGTRKSPRLSLVIPQDISRIESPESEASSEFLEPTPRTKVTPVPPKTNRKWVLNKPDLKSL